MHSVLGNYCELFQSSACKHLDDHLFLSFLSDLEDEEYVAFWRRSRILSLGHDWCLAHIPFFTKICPGYVGYGRDRGILQSLGVPHFFWSCFLYLHFKVNIDGLSKGNPGVSACTGVSRDHIGTSLGGFGISLGTNTACFAEAMCVILAVELADSKGWRTFWLKCESILVIHLLSNHSLRNELWKCSFRVYLDHCAQWSLIIYKFTIIN